MIIVFKSGFLKWCPPLAWGRVMVGHVAKLSCSS